MAPTTAATTTPTAQPQLPQNALGSPGLLTNGDGQPVERYAYTPYGLTTIADTNGAERSASAYGNPNAWPLHEEITRNHRCQSMDALLDMVFEWLERRRPFEVERNAYLRSQAA